MNKGLQALKKIKRGVREMKAILMSIKPQHVANILNKLKTIEIRKSIPNYDLPIDVYIYCTKEEKQVVFGKKQNIYLCDRRGKTESGFDFMTLIKNEDTKSFINDNLNGKVVAKFTLNKVEKIKYHFGYYDMGEWTESYILENACLSPDELDDYLQASKEYDKKKVSRTYGYAWHIDNLVPFDKPKDIKEFRRYCDKHFSWWTNKCLGCKAYTPDTDIEDYCNKNKLALTRAPQSWCYVEI